MKRIFISYGHEDANFAERIVTALKNNGYTVWFDKQFNENGIVAGENYDIKITSAIEEAINYQPKGKGRMVFFMSRDSIDEKSFCLNEIAYAYDHKLRILPIKLDDCTQPIIIYRYQHLDFRHIYNDNPDIESVQFQSSVQNLIDAIESEIILYNDDLRLLNNILSPLDYSGLFNAYLSEFCGREWFFRDFNIWLNNQHSKQVFLLVGLPGIGKSYISSRVLQLYRNVAAFHFFKRDNSLKASVKHAICSIAFQLSTRFEAFREYLKNRLVDLKLEDCNDAALFEELIINPLNRCPKQETPVLILLDAIDEANKVDGRSFFANYLSQKLANIPSWVRFFITCRNGDGYVGPLNSFETYHVYEIDPESNENINDISDYLGHDFPPERLRNTHGVFLYAYYLHNNGIPAGLNDLPNGLDAYYNNRFSYLFPEDRLRSYRTNIRPILEVLAAQVEPFTKERLSQCLSEDPNEDVIVDFMNELEGFFFYDVNKCIQPFHTSIIDWLKGNMADDRFRINVNRGNNVVGKWLFRILHNNDYNFFINGEDDSLLMNWLPTVLQKKIDLEVNSLDLIANYLRCVRDKQIIRDLVPDMKRFNYIKSVLTYVFTRQGTNIDIIDQAFRKCISDNSINDQAIINNLQKHATGLTYLFLTENQQSLHIPLSKKGKEYQYFQTYQIPLFYVNSLVDEAEDVFKRLSDGLIVAYREEGRGGFIRGILDEFRFLATGPFKEKGRLALSVLENTADLMDGLDEGQWAQAVMQNVDLISHKLDMLGQ